MKNSLSHFNLILIFFLYLGCSVEEKNAGDDNTNQVDSVEPETSTSTITDKLDFPNVYIEELDQSQEFFKEQHETSFSFVTNKNWFSFTAEKDGILTKILFYGKPNFQPSDHYGDSMHGFIREGNPNTGAKYGEWELSREDIVNQIAGQGLSERDSGWITIRMRGEIPQIAGKTYFIVCDKITGGKPWFGAFAFGEGNPYKGGRFWLHQDHDLVFRSYVGKTPGQAEIELKNETIVKNLDLQNQAKDAKEKLRDSLPVSQSGFSATAPSQIEPVENNATMQNLSLQEKIILTEKNSSNSESLQFITPNNIDLQEDNKTKKKSLFNRLFKNQ